MKAARRGDDTAVARLLQEGHDPTVSVGKTAYAVATEKSVRDAFRRHMANFPDQWDWTAAGVPSPLTAEMEAEQQAKEVNFYSNLSNRIIHLPESFTGYIISVNTSIKSV